MYEYRTSVLTGGFMGRHKEELKRSDLDAQLGEAGRGGWELTHVLMEQTLQGGKRRARSHLSSAGCSSPIGTVEVTGFV